MKKSDLKNGYVVDLRVDGYRRVVLFDELLIDENGRYERASSLIEKYRDDLTHRSDPNLDIMKVYDEGMDLIWEREEIDWNKVPFGTMVKCWNHGSSNKYVGKFLGYDECASSKFMVFVRTDIVTDWDYCELKDLKGEITGENLNDEFDRYCGKYRCDYCKYDDAQDCRWYWMVDNFNLTRK